MAHPSIAWTDETGPATLTWLAPVIDAFSPDLTEIQDMVVAQGTGATWVFGYRTDYTAAMQLAHLQAGDLALAMRLKSWLVRGGAVTLTTADLDASVYTATIAPGTTPTLTLSDRANVEYTLAFALRNSATAPLVARYQQRG